MRRHSPPVSPVADAATAPCTAPSTFVAFISTSSPTLDRVRIGRLSGVVAHLREMPAHRFPRGLRCFVLHGSQDALVVALATLGATVRPEDAAAVLVQHVHD